MYQYNYLIDHAINNVWCNPQQDNQLIFAGQRITRPSGELNKFKLMRRTVSLPEQGKYYHVFQVGQIHPNLVGLLSLTPSWAKEQWLKVSDAMTNLKLFANIYNIDGVELPRFKTYYLFTNDRDLVFAVEADKHYKVDSGLEQIYVRLYTNAYFQSYRSDALTDLIYCNGVDVIHNNDLANIRAEIDPYRSKTGFLFFYRNGYLVDDLDILNVKVGDSVEFVYDSSIKRVVTFTVSDLHTFNSALDDKFKYLLHHTSADNSTIDYQDDNDIHILTYKTATNYQGRYYHHNAIDSIRMVTHRDYSLPVTYFNAIGTELLKDLAINEAELPNCKIQIKIRKSGYYRPLVFDNNRIFELYKLPVASIEPTMLGIDSTVEEWRAETLEASGYTEIMRSEMKDVTKALVQKGYGYNAISSIVGNTPSKTVLKNGVKTAILPYGLSENATVYEYDASGKMVGWFPHIGVNYDTTNLNTTLVEAISGTGSSKPDVVFGIDDLPIPVYDNYRVYLKYTGLTPDGPWTDVTGSDLYKTDSGRIKWVTPQANQLVMVRTDKNFLAYDLQLSAVAGTFYFTIGEIEDRDGTDKLYALPVPMGELDIFLNGRSLINGLDYIVQFPMVYIINKKHLITPANTSIQNIHVRYTGFCNKDLMPSKIDDFGFIEHGVMSNNNRYDIRDDKVLRITMDGALYHRADITFSEFHTGISMVNAINGKPYQVKDIVVPLKQLVNDDTYTLREKSRLIDKHISDYLSIKLPQPPRNAISTITQRYVLISPFFTHIIFDMATDLIDNDALVKVKSDNDVLKVIQPYEKLLAFDPVTFVDEKLSKNVIVYPHCLDTTIDLKMYQYQTLIKIVKLYGNGLIDISPFVTFST